MTFSKGQRHLSCDFLYLSGRRTAVGSGSLELMGKLHQKTYLRLKRWSLGQNYYNFEHSPFSRL
jgi:hypothetical protein